MLVSPVVCSVYAGFIRVEFCTFKTGSKSIVGEKKHKICSQKLNLLLCILLLDCVVFSTDSGRETQSSLFFHWFSLSAMARKVFPRLSFFFLELFNPLLDWKYRKAPGARMWHQHRKGVTERDWVSQAATYTKDSLWICHVFRKARGSIV